MKPKPNDSLRNGMLLLALAAGLATLACGMPTALADGNTATAVFYVH